MEEEPMDSDSTPSDPQAQILSVVYKKIKNVKEKRKGKPLSILMTGRTGAGKSSLVNGLVGKIVSREGAALTAGTTEVEGYKFTKQGTDFIVFDSPGLQDATLDDQNTLEQVSEQLVAKCSEIDLVVYCMDMTHTRIDASDVNAIRHLTRGFTTELWKRAVVVLTFANQVSPPVEYDGTDEKHFSEQLERYKARIEELIPEVSIPVVPAGYWRKTRRNPNPWKLPDRDDWFSFFWFSCLNRMEEGAAISLLLSQASRIKVKSTTGGEKLDDDAEIHERPIYAKEDSDWLSFIVAEATGAGIGGVLGFLGVSGAVTTGGAAVAATTGTAVAAGTGASAAAGTAGVTAVGAAAGGAITTSVGGVGVGMGGKVAAAAITIAGGPGGLVFGGIVGLTVAYILYRQMRKK